MNRDQKKILAGAAVTVAGSLSWFIVSWFLALPNRLNALENSKITTEMTVQKIDKKTSKILCKMGEDSECDQIVRQVK